MSGNGYFFNTTLFEDTILSGLTPFLFRKPPGQTQILCVAPPGKKSPINW